MGVRFSLLLTLVLVALGAAFFFFTRPSPCTDPAGCIRIDQGHPLSIGIGVMTSGYGKDVSSEMLQSARLASQALGTIEGHELHIQPFYANCLPDSVDQAAIDLSADRQLLLALGPTCPEDTSEFVQRLSKASIGLLSPIPYQVAPQSGLLTFYPELPNLVGQTVQLIQQKGYNRIAVLAGPDPASQEAAKSICAASSIEADCLASQDTILPMSGAYDALLEVALDETQPLLPLWNVDQDAIPKVRLSFSRPHPLPGESDPAAWISPLAWSQADGYSSRFNAAYQTQPVSLSGRVVYGWFKYLTDAVQKVARGHWDGSLTLPRQALMRQVALGVNSDQPNRFACLQPDASCQGVPLALYTPSGNGTYILDPLIQ